MLHPFVDDGARKERCAMRYDSGALQPSDDPARHHLHIGGGEVDRHARSQQSTGISLGEVCEEEEAK